LSGSITIRDARWRPHGAFAVLVLLCCIAPAECNSNQSDPAQWSVDGWDMSRGYPGGRVYGITQTRDGYLWIGTDRGLIRFDGSAFQVFREIEPAHVAIDFVFALAGDSRGNLLISTLLGVHRLRLQNEELNELTPLPGQPGDPVSAIYQAQVGSVLIATVRRGIIAYDGERFAPLQDTISDTTGGPGRRWHSMDGNRDAGIVRLP
jgi:ligand-binding sensor domain-containing protein